MTFFYADLHIHSKYSRATSKHCDLENLAYWARRKGITVVATGDFTHPAWRLELEDKLLPAEPGLFKLRPDLQRAVDDRLGSACDGVTRFMLSVEISTIYKKGESTRKVHHLLYAPDFQSVDAIIVALSRIGNLRADGRPILGLDSRHLLEVTLESGPHCYLVPAHVWTPWFAALGSKSGFDSIVECYDDLADHIFAIETGLSSDPEMNWRLSQLDRYTLVSNSDAHSPSKLGREVNRFECELSYYAMRDALETRRGFAGTVEFFPEEGKYHLDGHRKCGVVLTPEATRELSGICPVCKRPLTVGVMHRVQELADRPTGFRPDGASPFRSLIPLPEVLSEILGKGVDTKTVAKNYEDVLQRVGDELTILERVPVEDIARAVSPQLAEAVARMRAGRVIRQPGYDGEYGVIRVFEDRELGRGKSRAKSLMLPGLSPGEPVSKPASEPGEPVSEPNAEPTSDANSKSASKPASEPNAKPASHPIGKSASEPDTSSSHGLPERPERGPTSNTIRSSTEVADTEVVADTSRYLGALDPEQRAAAATIDGPLLIVAGPGTGKTRTLTHRIAHLVAERDAPPQACLALTFTNRAAGEMRERLAALLPDTGERIPVMTFHGLALTMLREHRQACGLHRGFRIATDVERVDIAREELGCSASKAKKLLGRISTMKRGAAGQDAGMDWATPVPGHSGDASDSGPAMPAMPPTDDSHKELLQALATYRAALDARSLIDFDDVLILANRLLRDHEWVCGDYRQRFQWISIDEYQDIDELQYRMVRAICPDSRNLCAIGDPDQAIYGFRGADVGFFLRFFDDFPGARRVELTRNYRSSPTIVRAALQAIGPSSLVSDRRLVAQRDPEHGARYIEMAESASERAEAESVVHNIENLIGGTSFFSFDSGRVADGAAIPDDLGFSDIAVLYRTSAQVEPLREAFARSGMPFQEHCHGRLAERPGVARILSAMQAPPESADHAEPAPTSVADVLARAMRTLERDVEQTGDVDRAAMLSAHELLLSIALGHGDDMEAFLAEVACDLDVDAWDPRAHRVSLLTMHAAKGLEFRVVFVVGCEDGIVPLRLAGPLSDEELAEERRLFFVAVTRAKEMLWLTRARSRLWRGSVRPSEPCPFSRDIAKELLRHENQRENRRTGAGKRGTTPQQLGLF